MPLVHRKTASLESPRFQDRSSLYSFAARQVWPLHANCYQATINSSARARHSREDSRLRRALMNRAVWVPFSIELTTRT
jgi:hypothetical protein